MSALEAFDPDGMDWAQRAPFHVPDGLMVAEVSPDLCTWPVTISLLQDWVVRVMFWQPQEAVDVNQAGQRLQTGSIWWFMGMGARLEPVKFPTPPTLQ
jgi:hypothetical protein